MLNLQVFKTGFTCAQSMLAIRRFRSIVIQFYCTAASRKDACADAYALQML